MPKLDLLVLVLVGAVVFMIAFPVLDGMPAWYNGIGALITIAATIVVVRRLRGKES